MSGWNEARGVYDDICYLRQAHLFQRFGLGGFDTGISRDDDGYLVSKLKEIGFPVSSDKSNVPCHNPMPAAKKLVLQYPPGTGFVLALFPEGHQVIPLFASATVIVFGFALLGIFYARTTPLILLTTAFGCFAIYIMINPAKASYSMAPTMVICALAGFLTARLFGDCQKDNRVRLVVLLGFLLGLSVNFRLPNLLLSAGYFLFFLVAFLSSRTLEITARSLGFAAAFLAGMAPTLVANAINAGSPFATTYGGPDVAPPDFSFSSTLLYLTDMQFALLALAGASVAYHLRAGRRRNKAGRADRRGQPCGKFGLLLYRSPRHALLHCPDRDALAVEPVVRHADGAFGSGGRTSCGAGGRCTIMICRPPNRCASTNGLFPDDSIFAAGCRSGAVLQRGGRGRGRAVDRPDDRRGEFSGISSCLLRSAFRPH